MYIKEIYVENFGCLKDKSITFTDGLNLIYGSNESGKTTLLNFIAFMFYGTKIKKTSGELSFKQKYYPWNRLPISGRIVFCSEGLEYELSRTVNVDKSFVNLICITTGQIYKDTSVLNSPGEYFFGVSADTFCKTAFVTGLTSKILGSNSDEIVTKLRNIYETGEDEVSYKDIFDTINENILNLSSSKRKNAVIPQLEKDIRETTFIINSEKKDALILKNYADKSKQVEDKILKLQTELSIYKNKRERCIIDDIKPKSSKYILITLFSIIISLWGYIFDAILGVCFCVFFAVINCILWYLYRRQKNEIQRKSFTINDIDDKIKRTESQLTELKIEDAVLKERLNNRSNFDTGEYNKKLSYLNDELKNAKKELDSYLLALKALQMGYDSIKTVFSPKLSDNASRIFEYLTSGKYNKIIVDDKLDINFKADTGYTSALYMSCGAVEQAYLALRLALSEMIFEENNIPLFMDDIFVHYDDARTKNAINYIHKVSLYRQVFCSACKEQQLNYFKNKQNINLILL